MSHKRQRVAVVYHFFAHYRAAVMRQLLASPCHDYILVGDRVPTDPSIKAWDIPPSVAMIPARCCQPMRGLMLQRGLLRLALRRDIDQIIYLGNAAWPCTWLSAAVARLMGKRVWFWSHGWTRHESGLKDRVRCLFYKLAHGLLLYGHVAKTLGVAKGFAPERLHVIYNSLDYEAQKQARANVTPQRLEQIRTQLFDQPDHPIVICTTRLTALRRLDLLMEALALLKREGHHVNLLLVGDGPERENLQQLAKRLDLPVHFFGPCYDEQALAELVMSAHATVAPGQVGLTAMHSLAYGTPVITHDDVDAQMPEWEAIVPGQTGDFFQHDDVQDLAAVIKKWTQTPRPQEQIRDRCYRMIDRFYHPAFQRIAIDRAVSGRPADDLFWLKEDHPFDGGESGDEGGAGRHGPSGQPSGS